MKNDEEYNILNKENENFLNTKLDDNFLGEIDKNKIFLTAGVDLNGIPKYDEIITYHDLIVPGGKNSRLVRFFILKCLIHEPSSKTIRVTEIADHYKFYDPCPVINIIGGNSNKVGKLMAGLTRAAYNTRAIIVDSGVETGVEQFCLRKNITLIGIAPEFMIELPKPNSDLFSKKMLTNGHSHFILIGNNENKLVWGEECKLKVSFIERLLSGRKGYNYKCKTVGILMGNIDGCENEINYVSFFNQYIERKYPLILIEDSELSCTIKEIRNGTNKEISNEFFSKVANYPYLIEIEEDSENLASAVHICLVVSL